MSRPAARSPAGRSRLGRLEPEQWYAQLATQYAAAGALFTDPDGKVLLVKPNYREYWTLPGGMVDHGETPGQVAARVTSYTAARVSAALSARAAGTTLYLPQQARPGI